MINPRIFRPTQNFGLAKWPRLCHSLSSSPHQPPLLAGFLPPLDNPVRSLTSLFVACLLALASAHGQSAPTALDKTLQEGTRAYETRDFTKAARLFAEVLAKAAAGPQLEPVAFFHAAALVESGETEPAIKALLDFPKKYPASARIKAASVLLARVYAKSGRIDQALALLRPLENDPELRAEVLRAQIVALRAAGRSDEAAAVQQRLLPTRRTLTRPEALVAQQLLATQLNDPAGDLDTARQTLLALWSAGPVVDNLAALNTASLVLGGRFLAANRPEEALLLFQNTRPRDEVLSAQRRRVDELTEALRLVVPGNAAAESTKADLEHRLAQAKDALQRLTDTTDFDRQVLLRLGFAYLALSRPWEATLVFRTGLERHGSTAEAPLFLYGLVTARQLAGRPAEAVALGREFFAKYPSAPERLDVALAAGGAALDSGDIAAAITFFSGVTADKPAAPDPKAEAAFLQLGHAYFAAGNWSAASAAYTRFHEIFPSSKFAEDVDYRSALATLFGGDLKPARKQLEAYLEKYPQAKYEPDARYRLAVCAYGSQEWDRALKLTADWQASFADNPQLGDVLALRGDVFRSTRRPTEAVDAYRLAVASAGNDQVLSYALNEASTLLEEQRDWPALAALFQDTLAARPGHASSLAWMNGIAKARARLGQFDEAASSLVAFAKSDIARIDNDAVETTLSLIAQLAARTKPAAGEATADPPAPPAWEAELFAGHSDLIVQARQLYFESELARLRKRPAEASALLLRIGRDFKSSELSAPLLALGGEALLAAGQPDAAAPHFEALLERYPLSTQCDIAMTGLGEIALRSGDAARALSWARDAQTKGGGAHRAREATLLEGRSLLELGKLDEAEALFTRVASTKEWRGEATAQSLFLLGSIAEKRGDLPKAIALHQRVFLSHQRYPEWVARAYLASANAFSKLGRTPEAVATLKEMLRSPRLADRPELAEARTLLASLETP